MMDSWMLHVLYSSFSASVLIGAVLLIRWFVTKRAPRWIACLLWGMVGVRLLIPFSIESELSVLPALGQSDAESETSAAESQDLSAESFGESIAASAVSPEGVSDAKPSVSMGETTAEGSADTVSFDESEESEESAEYSAESADETAISSDASSSAPAAGTQSEPSDSTHGKDGGGFGVVPTVWLCGTVALALYAVVSGLLLRRRVAVFSVETDGIRHCESIDSPFVLGFFRPHIYLPYGISEETQRFIVAHEKAHISRFDHVTKLLAFAALALHWFNPAVWLAFVLFCRDIEYACDEKVVRTLNEEERKKYASALLACASRKK